MLTVNEKRELLDNKKKEKLRLAAQMLKATAEFYDECKPYLLPLWGAGVITHGQPKIKAFIIGISKRASKGEESTTLDHLYRVTETAKFILSKLQKENLSIEEIEDILLKRSEYMVVTRSENSGILKETLKKISNKDNWEVLYEKAGVEYTLNKK